VEGDSLSNDKNLKDSTKYDGSEYTALACFVQPSDASGTKCEESILWYILDGVQSLQPWKAFVTLILWEEDIALNWDFDSFRLREGVSSSSPHDGLVWKGRVLERTILHFGVSEV
jgi:hypothetical protein